MSYLARILVYPIKSLDGVEVERSHYLKGGALAHDREFALIDQAGQFLNGKRSPALHQIRSAFDLDARLITLWLEGSATQSFHLDGDRSALETWFSDYLGEPVRLQQDTHLGFPDDTESSGPTVISVASLQTVGDWFGMSLEETRRRFRTNLEIEGVPAFWEDQLYDASGAGQPFWIGEVTLNSDHCCQRCIVPTRNPWTGDRQTNFQQQFSAYRADTLPDGAPRSQFNHFYRLALNTKVAASEADKVIQVGDRVGL